MQKGKAGVATRAARTLVFGAFPACVETRGTRKKPSAEPKVSTDLNVLMFCGPSGFQKIVKK